jgi:hemerythrin-like domain-containing protein
MISETVLADCLEAALADHGIVSNYLGSTRRVIAAKSAKASAKEIERIGTMTRKLANHFALEERRIFPALLTTSHNEATARNVSRLIAEHRKLLRRAEILDEVLRQQSPHRKPSDQFLSAMVEFLNQLKAHASAEDDMFISLLQKAR